MIKAGETETVSFYLTLSDLEFVDASGKWNAETGAFDITIGNLITTFNLKI
jgi:thiamine biosynthesis lipoprotein ApbE